MPNKRIVVAVSGGGTNLQAILDAIGDGRISSAEVVCVLSSKPGVAALRRAQDAGIPTVVVPRKDAPDAAAFDRELLAAFDRVLPDLIVLAGFMCVLGPEVLRTYQGKIINIHPSLIPAFCGEGMYGLRVHQAALDYGVKVTGATVHFVNEVVDGGKIIAQKAVGVREDDTPASLQRRVMEQAEWVILPEAIEEICGRGS